MQEDRANKIIREVFFTILNDFMSENPLVNLAGILFPLIGLFTIPQTGIHQSTYQLDLGNYYAR
jgi:hypothetical protein